MKKFYPLPTSEVYVDVPTLSHGPKSTSKVSAEISLGKGANQISGWTLQARTPSPLPSTIPSLESESEGPNDERQRDLKSLKEFIVKDEVTSALSVTA